MNKSVLSLPDRYGGLYFMASQIGAYFPKTKYYVEPFSGLARTAKYSRSETVILNDKSKLVNEKCRKLFSNAVITNDDFEECIKKYDSKETFFLIDPPYDVNYYNGDIVKEEVIKNNLRNKSKRPDKKAVHMPVIDRTVKQYLDKLKEILPGIKGQYIVTLSLQKNFKSPYEKILKDIKPHLFGNYPSSHLYSNRPLKIQIPQITEFIEC